MVEFDGSETALVADVDCTAGGKALCDANGVSGYPTLKYGDPSDLQDYQGARDLESLTKFATENLKPMCSPSNIDLCDDEKKAEIKKFSDMTDADLDKLIAEKEEENETAEKTFKDEVQKLQDSYTQLSSDKDAKLEEIKNSGLGLMKSVKASKKTEVKDEL
jgi:hypothetical protein